MRLLVCYDVSEQGRRSKLSRTLSKFMSRVQRSTFEGDVASDALDVIRQAADMLIDHETDTVRIYFLCGACHPRTEHVGTGPVIDDDQQDLVF